MFAVARIESPKFKDKVSHAVVMTGHKDPVRYNQIATHNKVLNTLAQEMQEEQRRKGKRMIMETGEWNRSVDCLFASRRRMLRYETRMIKEEKERESNAFRMVILTAWRGMIYPELTQRKLILATTTKSSAVVHGKDSTIEDDTAAEEEERQRALHHKKQLLAKSSLFDVSKVGVAASDTSSVSRVSLVEAAEQIQTPSQVWADVELCFYALKMHRHKQKKKMNIVESSNLLKNPRDIFVRDTTLVCCFHGWRIFLKNAKCIDFAGEVCFGTLLPTYHLPDTVPRAPQPEIMFPTIVAKQWIRKARVKLARHRMAKNIEKKQLKLLLIKCFNHWFYFTRWVNPYYRECLKEAGCYFRLNDSTRRAQEAKSPRKHEAREFGTNTANALQSLFGSAFRSNRRRTRKTEDDDGKTQQQLHAERAKKEADNRVKAQQERAAYRSARLQDRKERGYTDMAHEAQAQMRRYRAVTEAEDEEHEEEPLAPEEIEQYSLEVGEKQGKSPGFRHSRCVVLFFYQWFQVTAKILLQRKADERVAKFRQYVAGQQHSWNLRTRELEQAMMQAVAPLLNCFPESYAADYISELASGKPVDLLKESKAPGSHFCAPPRYEQMVDGRKYVDSSKRSGGNVVAALFKKASRQMPEDLEDPTHDIGSDAAALIALCCANSEEEAVRMENKFLNI